MENGREKRHARAENARGRGTAPRAKRARPSTDQLFGAVVELVSDGSSAFKGTARRYSLCAADAEDAYQRGLEILITKAPTADTSELRPWLHTVVKHEALAIRRQRERLLAPSPDSPTSAEADKGRSPEDGAGERERARQTAEALGQLKSSELQCLLLKALGYSYTEIAARTGFSWTKVNRSLTEGRKHFFDRFAQIESGKRCERFEAVLTAVSDGEAAPKDERLLRAHLRSCSSCKAILRDYRTVPSRLAELLPPSLMAPSLDKGSWWSRLYDSIAAATGDRAAMVGHKLQQAGELVTAQKTAAVVASTAALAGGAAVHDHTSHRHGGQDRARISADADPPGSGGQVSPPAVPQDAPHPSTEAAPRSQAAPDPTTNAQSRPQSTGEFIPEAQAASPAPASTVAEERFDALPPKPSEASGRRDGATSGGGEFGP